MLTDLYDFHPLPDLVAETYANPHFQFGCDVKFEVSVLGLVYCGDCANQIGSIPMDSDLCGRSVGGNGRASRWLQADQVQKAWADGAKVDLKRLGVSRG